MNGQASQVGKHVARLRDGTWKFVPDELAVEEPLAIRIVHSVGGVRQETPLTVTMRTPGHDFELAAGFLFGERLIGERRDVLAFDYANETNPSAQDAVRVTLREGLAVNLAGQQRNFTTTSSCGVCGKASLDALVMEGCRTLRSAVTISATTLTGLPAVLREAQHGFESTGGVHAAGLFTADGRLVAHAEDVGRHNAFDKVIGAQFLAGETNALEGMVAILSGRASYELLQKALRARIPVVAAVGAPSSLAVEIAETFGITLAGFLKPGGFNVYAGRERIFD